MPGIIRVQTLLTTLALIASSEVLNAQQADSTALFTPRLSVQTGYIIKNYPSFPSRSASLLGQFDAGFQTLGRRHWQSAMRWPEAGVSLVAGSLGNQQVLGNAAGLMPYLGWRLTNHDGWHLYLKAGLGFAWITNPYNEITNPENTLIGSYLTNMTQLAAGASVPVGKQLALDAGLSFFHFSNGHTHLPNLGINMPCVYAGLRLNPAKGDKPPRYSTPDTLPDRFQMVVEMTGGIHQFGESTEPTGGPVYPVYGASIGIRWLPSQLHTFTASVEWDYYSGFYDFAVLNRMSGSQTWLYASTIVVYAGHEFILGHFGIDTRMGVYLFNPFRHDYSQDITKTSEGGKLYSSNKLGFNWYLWNPAMAKVNIRLGIYIKANLGQADYTCAGISFIF